MNRLNTEERARIVACLAEGLRVTPAMEAGLTDHVWSVEEIAGLKPQPQETHEKAHTIN